jgi:transposase-like protein
VIKPKTEKWDQTISDLRRLAIEAEHPRSRERFQALYMIANGQSNATQWARQIGRKNQTVMEWVHQYNESGPKAIHYTKTGGRAPLFTKKRSPS